MESVMTNAAGKVRFVPAMFAALMLCACDPGPSPDELQAIKAQRAEAAAQQQVENFRQLKTAGRAALALNLAEHLLATYPQSQAAASVRGEIEALRAEVNATRETARLSALWVYHDGDSEEAGGRVRSAYIFSKSPIGPAQAGKEAPRARMVLRRHPEWGDSVYLLSERGPFTCGTPCQVTLRFDDAPARTVGGEIPSTGEHAIFVEDFAYFATHLADASVVSIDVTLQDGGAQTVQFEVGGYDTETIGTP